MNLPKVLVISYYFPPSGGPGVQRVLKFVRQLPKHGWQSIVLTVRKDADFIIRDESLLAEIPKNLTIKRTPIIEPYSLYRKLTGKEMSAEIDLNALTVSQGGRRNLGERLSLFLRNMLFIPDARVGWLPFAVYSGLKMIHQHKPGIIFSSGPPNTVHLIAYLLKKFTKTPWIADFRDPWFKYLAPERSHSLPRKIDTWLAEQVVVTSDRIVTVCNGVKKELESDFHDLISEKIDVITNGFSQENFDRLDVPEFPCNQFRMVYVGSIFVKYDMSKLVTALNSIWNSYTDFRDSFKFIICGRVDPNVRRQFQESQFASAVEYLGYRNYFEALALMQSATVLLLYIMDTERGKNIPTSKLYEYLGTKRIILALSPKDSDAAEIIQQTKAGFVISPSNSIKIKQTLLFLYDKWQRKRLDNYESDYIKLKKYEIEKLTKKLVKTFDKILTK